MDQTPSTHSDVHHTVRSVSLGTLWRILRYPFVLLSMALIPRVMGDAAYGRYAYFMSLFLILDMLTDFGIFQVLGRFVPEYAALGEGRKIRYLLHGTLTYGLLLACIPITGLMLVSAVHPIHNFPLRWVAILILLLLSARVEGTLYLFMYGLNQIARFSAKEIFRSAFVFFFVIGFYWFFGLDGAFWALLANELVLLIIAVSWMKDYINGPWTFARFADFKPYLIFGFQFYVPTFLFGLMQRSGNVFVKGLTQSSQQVAYFDIANQFLLLTATFLGLILTTILPALTALYVKNDMESIRRWQRTILTYCGVAAFLGINALGWMGRDIIRICLGPSFAPVMGNAMVVVLAIVPVLIAYAGINYSILEKRPGVYARAVALGIIIMAAGCLVLTPRYRALGASWATVLGYSAMAAVFCAKYRQQFAAVLGPFAVTLLVGVCLAPLWLFRPSICYSALLFVGTTVVYVAALSALKVLRWSDAMKIWKAFSGSKEVAAPQTPIAGT